jgi:uncharacterized protein (DUF362 family)
MSKVVIVKGTNPVETTVRALNTIRTDLESIFFSNKPILIKPNYINSKHPSTGITTDSRVIEGIIKFLKLNKTKNITIGEGSGFTDTFEAYKIAGIDVVAEHMGVKLLDLNKDTFIEVKLPNQFSLKNVKISQTALKSSIISVPKLKLHRLTMVSLSLKNMMGTIASKGSMHNGRLNKNIVDLASLLIPKVSVIDGFIAGEGHETSGNPVEMDLVIAGTDPVAVDAVGAALMGINPNGVKHLVLAEEKGLGTCNLEEINILGESLEKIQRKFRRSLVSKFLSYVD